MTKLLDHIGINLMIAGSYPPMLLLCRANVALACMWLVAVLNMVHKACTRQEVGLANVIAFLAMGWSVMVVK